MLKNRRSPIQLSDHFTFGRLMRFVTPSIIMMIFTSIYGVVDGFFVSNVVGKTPFAAVNLIMPFLMIFGGIGFMIGTGGSAIIARNLGMGDKEKANSVFSMLIYVTIVVGAVLTVIGVVFLRPISIALGAEGEVIDYCVAYGRIILFSLIAFMLQNVFQSFLVTAEKPKLGLYVTVAAGVTNMIGDWLLVSVFNMGVEGAALATALSQVVGGVIPLIYFARPNSSLLKLTSPRNAKMDWKVLLYTCTNGSSELMSNISASIVNMLYNAQLLKYAGEDGVAAYGVIMYVNFIFIAIYIGYSIGSAPIIGFNYGAENTSELQNIFKKSMKFMLFGGVILTASAILLASPLANIFVSYDEALLEMTVHGFKIYSLAFLICGFSIFGSSMFTALSNGLVSALISFLRTLLFQVSMVLVMPLIWQLDGVWWSVVAAEVISIIVTFFFIFKMRPKYKYF